MSVVDRISSGHSELLTDNEAFCFFCFARGEWPNSSSVVSLIASSVVQIPG